MNIFEQATRSALRFQSTKGMLLVEDLWSMGLVPLNALAIALNDKVQTAPTTSFISELVAPVAPEGDVLRLEILKHIITVKLAERKDATEANERSAQKSQLLAILARKQTSELEGKSVEEIQAMIAAV